VLDCGHSDLCRAALYHFGLAALCHAIAIGVWPWLRFYGSALHYTLLAVLYHAFAMIVWLLPDDCVSG
jgi:hypothetical protein